MNVLRGRGSVVAVAAVGALLYGVERAAAQTPTAAAATAKAELKDAKGQTVGQADLTDTGHGLLVHVRLSNAPAGVHAFHIHTTGKCDPPDFTSAGGHFNPTKAQHGFANAQGHHLGDMPNIHVPQGGMLEYEFIAPMATLSAGANSVFDADGSALMLHAAADDYKSDPAGNAGARVACGVIAK